MGKERDKIKRRGKVQREFHSTVTGAEIKPVEAKLGHVFSSS
jgi:hypothetical protein